jgi:hypothetical protein
MLLSHLSTKLDQAHIRHPPLWSFRSHPPRDHDSLTPLFSLGPRESRRSQEKGGSCKAKGASSNARGPSSNEQRGSSKAKEASSDKKRGRLRFQKDSGVPPGGPSPRGLVFVPSQLSFRASRRSAV